MTATTSIRAAVKQRLTELLVDEMLDVDRTQPRRGARREGLVIGSAAGRSTVANQKTGRQQRDDRFTVTVYAYCRRPGKTAAECEERAEELLVALESLLAENPRLAVGGNGLPGLVVATLGEWSGPDSETFDDEGFHAWCEATVVCHARLI